MFQRALSNKDKEVKFPDYKPFMVKKIKLQHGEIPKMTGMYDPARVIVCAPGDKIFLFTPGLRPCIAALAFCRLKGTGKTIIGVAHITPLNKDLALGHGAASRMLENGQLKEILKQGLFQPCKLMSMIKRIENYSEFMKDKDQIEIYFAGGRVNDFPFDVNLHKLYCEYIRLTPNIKLRGFLFNPFGLHKSIIKNLDIHHFPADFSLTAGINSNGEITLCKTYDISFDMDVNKFPDRKSLVKFFEKNKLDISEERATINSIMDTFDRLTAKGIDIPYSIERKLSCSPKR